MIVADVHNHTNASHGKASVGEMYAAAKDRGLAVYGFSEHSPRPEAYSYPVEYREHLRQNFVRYASEVMQLRALSGSPKVLLGMELDWFPSERPFMEAAVAAYPFDYIIGGIHFLGSWGFDFTQDDWKISPQQCYTRYENYFRTLADMARSGLVDIAAHPDIIKLYSVDVFHQWLAMPESLALISEALTAIRDNGLVMEISSAGLRKPCNEIYPHPAIMRLASDLGVKISFGSDAHCPNTPAYAYSSTTSKLNGRYSEQSYVTPNTSQLLELVNTKLSPYAEVFTRSDLDMMTVNSDGSVSSSTGHVEDSNATHPRSHWQAQWTPQEPEEETPDYPVTIFVSREGYFKKITPQSLRMSGEQKLKDGDEVLFTCESTNSAELLFFTNHHQVYKSHAYDFGDSKASVLGDYVASSLGMEEGEVPLYMVVTPDYKGWMLFFFQNGKCAKVLLSSYETKQNRRKLLKAYSDKEELACMRYLPAETELAIFTTNGRLLLAGSALIPEKATRDSAGVNVVTLKKNAKIARVTLADGLELGEAHRYRVRTLPAAGAILRADDSAEQLTL